MPDRIDQTAHILSHIARPTLAKREKLTRSQIVREFIEWGLENRHAA